MAAAGELVVDAGQPGTPAMSAWSPPTGAAPEPPLRRPYLPCVPAPVYRGRGSHSTVAVPRALPLPQSGCGIPGRPGPTPQTPPAADAAATRPRAGPGAPEAVGSNPEGGTTPEAEAGPEASPQSPLRWASERAWPGPKLRRSRTVFSIWQVSTLEKAFQKAPYPSLEDTAGLARELRITEAQVKIWFQNRRKKLKRQLQEQAQFLAPTQSNPFWTMVSPEERLQPDSHTCPFLCGQNSVLPPTCIPGFNHSLYDSRDLQALGLQMPHHHPNF
ncbi:transcription factor LBX2-like [Sarcophilus harrisii]|uniref:transcription factor LBX2-like n=1 Tax=Sarcophilus harrisii TaxID=9305 RepID=UPI001301F5DB|nr:transcription factor LBX2-like [Sarcophilus harrisii]